MAKVNRKPITNDDLIEESPQMNYKDAIDQEDHDEAFAIYFRERNFAEVERKTGIPKATLYSWRRRYNWDERIAKIEAKSRVKIDRSLQEMNDHHSKVFRFLQLRAFQELKDGEHIRCPTCKKYITVCPHCEKEGIKTQLEGKLKFKSVGEASKVLDTAIKGERLVAGLTTSNVGTAIIQNLSDEFSNRLGIALGRLLDSGFITDFIISKIVNEFSQAMNEKPITVAQLRASNQSDDDYIDAEYVED